MGLRSTGFALCVNIFSLLAKPFKIFANIFYVTHYTISIFSGLAGFSNQSLRQFIFLKLT
jgi:hypothetical protein